MSEISLIIFYLTLLILLNSFIFYPIIIHFFFGMNKKSNYKENFEPTITIMIAAYNEEKVIGKRIDNIATMDYNFEKVEVLIGSDNSTDNTNEILNTYEQKYDWLKVFFFNERKGKAGILNELIKEAKNEIIVFTDANTQFQSNAIRNLVADFVDKNIGGVCGKLMLIENENSKSESNEEKKYWLYENVIKRAEGEAGISFSANGGIFAIRKELYQQIPTDKPVTDDLFISLSVVSRGYKFTFEEDAIALEEISKDVKDEYKRKVRFSATNFQTLVHFKNLLYCKNKLLSYAFISHKVTRWFLPFLLLLFFISSWTSASYSPIAFMFFAFQIFFYFFALVGFIFSLMKMRFSLFSIPFYFVVSNHAVFKGFILFLKNKHSVIWESTRR